MRAVLMERGKLWVDEVSDPVPGAGEVLVKSVACGICGSDLHAARFTQEFVETSIAAGGAFKLTTFNPVVLGHEFCAEIVDHGPDTNKSSPVGSLVCSVPALVRKPVLSVGYSDQVPGGFGEYMVLSERLLQPVPSGTSAHDAALTEPMAVGYHAVEKARLEGHEAVVVIGAGPVGLAVLLNLKQRGAGPVIVSERSPGRRALAESLGADIVVNPDETSPFDRKELDNDGNTVIFECVGVPGMIDQIFLGAPRNARIVVVGVCLQMDQARPLIAINKELAIQFVLGYSAAEFAETLALIGDGALRVESLITDVIPLDQVADTFQDLAQPNTQAKVLVEPWQ